MTQLFYNDLPDDYQWLPGSVRFPLADMGELAARLGSPSTYDRRGEVLFWDLFDWGLSAWVTYAGSPGGSVKVGSQYTFRGGYNIRLTSGASVGGLAVIYRNLMPLGSTRIGFEVGLEVWDRAKAVEVDAYLYDTSHQYNYEFFIDPVNKLLKVHDNILGFVTIASIPDPVDAGGAMHNVKLVFDIGTFKYVRVLYDDNEYDISAYNAYIQPPVTSRNVDFIVAVDSNGADNPLLLLDYAIITANEP